MNSGTIASATTTDLGTKTQNYLSVTGTTTITGLGTPTNKVEYTVRFAGALTLTHNATSLILPGGANIPTAAGDVAVMKHEGSGNWRCISYSPATGVGAVGGTTATSGKVLTANGSGSVPTWQTPSTGTYAAKTAGYTIVAGDRSGVIDWTTAGFTATLTAAATLGSGFTVTLMNTATTGDVTIDPNSTETLDGLTTRLLRPGDRVELVCDGTNWKTVRGDYTYTSGLTTLTFSSVHTLAHGLGIMPKEVFVWMECRTIDIGYAVGDRVPVNYMHNNATATHGVGVNADTTNIKIMVSSNISLLRKDTAAIAQIGAAGSWKLVARAFA